MKAPTRSAAIELTAFGERSARPSLAHTLWMLTICSVAYLWAFPYQPPINNPNENVRFYMTAAIVENGSYAIDAQRARWGWVNDAGVRDGKHYSVKAPGASLLAVPGYWAYRTWCEARAKPVDRTTALWVCRITASVLPMLLFLFFLHRFLGRATEHPVLRDATFFSIALGSLLYAYALQLVSHTQSATAAFGALMCLSCALPLTRTRAVLAGLLAASVTLFEYPGLMASVPLTLYAVSRAGLGRVPYVAAGCVPPVLAMMHFQWRAWGNPLTPGHRFLENQAFRALSEEGFFGATGFHLDAAAGLLFDPGYGLFALTPLLLAAPFGFWLAIHEPKLRAPAVAAGFTCILSYGLICTMNNWRGGWTVGPRYLAVSVPFLGWLALIGLDRIAARARQVAHGLALGALAAGILLSGLVSVYYPHVPEALARPVPDLVLPLMRASLVPFNAGHWFGMTGTLAMTPVFIALALPCVIGLAVSLTRLRPHPGPLPRGGRGRRSAVSESMLQRSILVGTFLISALILSWPAWAPATNTRAASRARASVLRKFVPKAHASFDAASKKQRVRLRAR